MLKDPTELVQETQNQRNQDQLLQDKQQFDNSLFGGLKVSIAQMLGTMLKVVKDHTFSVKVDNQIKLPEIQKIQGRVSLAETTVLLEALNSITDRLNLLTKQDEGNASLLVKELKPIGVDFSNLEQAIKAIKIPVTEIPDYPTTMQISNLDELKQPLEKLSKVKPVAPIVNVPAFPKSVSVGNLGAIESILTDLCTKMDKEDEEEPIGYTFTKNDLGQLTSFTEKYESGDVISKGWALGKVSIEDHRNNS